MLPGVDGDVCGGKVKQTLDQEDVLVVSLILSLEIALTVHVLRSSGSCMLVSVIEGPQAVLLITTKKLTDALIPAVEVTQCPPLYKEDHVFQHTRNFFACIGSFVLAIDGKSISQLNMFAEEGIADSHNPFTNVRIRCTNQQTSNGNKHWLESQVHYQWAYISADYSFPPLSQLCVVCVQPCISLPV